MRAIVRRHRLRAGDQLVLSPPNTATEDEVLSPPIAHVGEETVVLTNGVILEVPSGHACYIERRVSEEQLLHGAVDRHGERVE